MTEPVRYVFSPRPTRGVLLGLGVAQLVALAVGMVVAFGAMSAGSLAGGLTALLLAAVYAFLPVGGFPVHEWAGSTVRHGWAVLRRRQTWVADVAPLTLPPELAGLVIHDHHGIGLIEGGGRRRTWTGLLRVSGTEFPLLEEDEQVRRVAAWGDVLAGLAREGLRVQVVERAVPDTGDEQARWIAAHLAVDGPAAEDYLALVATAEGMAVRHESYVALEVTPPRTKNTAETSADEEAKAHAVREVELLAQRLAAAELAVSKPLPPDEIALVLRTAVDPSALATAVSLALAGQTQPTTWGPMARVASWSTYATDDVHHAIYWMAEWPRLPVGSDWLWPLLGLRTSAIRTVSLIMEPLDPARAIRRAERDVLGHDVDAAQRSKWGMADKARGRRERDAAQQREEELVSGYADVRFVGLVSVTAGTVEDLDMACRDVEQASVQSGLDLRRLYGRQADAFVATLPACRGLKAGGWLG